MSKNLPLKISTSQLWKDLWPQIKESCMSLKHFRLVLIKTLDFTMHMYTCICILQTDHTVWIDWVSDYHITHHRPNHLQEENAIYCSDATNCKEYKDLLQYSLLEKKKIKLLFCFVGKILQTQDFPGTRICSFCFNHMTKSVLVYENRWMPCKI